MPVYGIVDTGADITIIDGKLFKLIATKAIPKLKKKDLQQPDKVLRNYDGNTLTLDGKMDLKVTFQEKYIIEPIYIKMDAKDQLLLSETVCQQLGIISYHPRVEVWNGGHQDKTELQLTATVPLMRVKLIQATRFLPHQTTAVQVYVGDHFNQEQSILLEAKDTLEGDTGLQMDTSLIKPDDDGNVFVLVTNTKGDTLKLDTDTELGHVSNVVQAHDLGCNQTELVSGVQQQSKWSVHVALMLKSEERN